MRAPTYHYAFLWVTCRSTLNTWCPGLCFPYAVIYTMEALSNSRLAQCEDIADLQEAVNPALAQELFDADACWEGMRSVGMHARDWYHLDELIEREGRDDWADWLDNGIPDRFES